MVSALCEQAGVDPAGVHPQWRAARASRHRHRAAVAPSLAELSAVEDQLARITDTELLS